MVVRIISGIITELIYVITTTWILRIFLPKELIINYED